MSKMARSEAGKLGYLKSKNKLLLLIKKREDNYFLNPKKCKYCEETIPYDKRNNNFCNQSCAASFRNSKKTKKELILSGYKLGQEKYCLNCSEIFIDNNWHGGKFCSSKCCGEYTHKQTILKMEKTGIIPDRHVARKILIKRCNNTCEICSFKEWMGKPIALVMDHINGNPEDNRTVNLRMICPNCDAQTSTYKGKNKGHGRHYRRERYRQGKSY